MNPGRNDEIPFRENLRLFHIFVRNLLNLAENMVFCHMKAFFFGQWNWKWAIMLKGVWLMLKTFYWDSSHVEKGDGYLRKFPQTFALISSILEL